MVWLALLCLCWENVCLVNPCRRTVSGGQRDLSGGTSSSWLGLERSLVWSVTDTQHLLVSSHQLKSSHYFPFQIKRVEIFSVRQISILRELWRSQQGNVCEMKRRETVTNGWKEQERLQSDMGWWWWWGTMAHKNNRLCSVRSGVRVTQPVKNYYSSAFTFRVSSASTP